MIFNLRDQIRDKVIDPLQFQYIPANCRLYYKSSNVYNMPNLWHDVANANWNDESLCIPGSITAADTSTKPPPPTNITAIPPLVNWPIDDAELASVISEGGDGIQDGGKRTSGMKACDNSCSACQTISFRCEGPNSPVKSQSVCLQRCTLKTASSCEPGTSFVSDGVVLHVNTKALGVEKRAVGAADNRQDVRGVCKPPGTFIQKTGLFGCPRSS